MERKRDTAASPFSPRAGRRSRQRDEGLSHPPPQPPFNARPDVNLIQQHLRVTAALIVREMSTRTPAIRPLGARSSESGTRFSTAAIAPRAAPIRWRIRSYSRPPRMPCSAGLVEGANCQSLAKCQSGARQFASKSRRGGSRSRQDPARSRQGLGRPANSVYQSLGRIRRVLLECIERQLAAAELGT